MKSVDKQILDVLNILKTQGQLNPAGELLSPCMTKLQIGLKLSSKNSMTG